jgi:two-component system, NarL family, sensor kinase
LRETRTISYLMHPPLLDHAGFESAAREYVEGFSRRSGVPVTLNMDTLGARLPATFELAMFRVLQESLANILKHSGSSQATVTVAYPPDQAVLTVQDYGKGMPLEILESFRSDGAKLGVGLAGMRERMRELNGNLEIQSDSSGTLVTAILTRPKAGRSESQPEMFAV